ncbi:ATP-dependent Clp protease adapter ClpS [Pseudodesulfovibrio sp. F-1]|uniref:ATP-dependent Clp protease adapter protein ClpS n=1 Tax=Pseudodesulfovibrio alkaliphilus TaxID=2661613 RepID=A0A7K1KQF9_9BACT|nr:ATP-dependent Clp protease adapter ClpS [Pseudodesulfovibrio alkaliphilus]MUM78336.1 ATP-dependent Clp protease adapter ClpS [Pseudodesulfovibrio alkaliphilus]
MSDPLAGDQATPGLRDEREVREPRKYKVLLHNDDYTTMDFVVEVLVRVFHKNEAQATAIMLAVHNQGFGVCGTYTAEVAETKVDMVHRLARSAGFPLKCSMEGE